MITKKYRMVRIPKEKIPKELLEIRPAKSSGATVMCDFSVWPDWVRKSRDPEKDLILFCPCEDSESESATDCEKPVGRLTIIREDEKDRAKGFPFNKDVYVLSKDTEGAIILKKLESKNKRDHWMKRIISEYLGWPVLKAGKSDEDK
jgi:hypothetical protein